jgi:hypothetical protein
LIPRAESTPEIPAVVSGWSALRTVAVSVPGALIEQFAISGV